MLEQRVIDASTPPLVFRDVAQLDRTGAPMMALVDYGRLPSRRFRLCTSYLKVQAAHKYLHGLSDYKTTKYLSLIGFRADEPRRLAKMRDSNDAVAAREDAGKHYLKWIDEMAAPLADAGMTREDVLKVYRSRPLAGLSFDPSDDRLLLSNCRGCFFGNRAAREQVAREHQRFAEYWEALERKRFEDMKRKGQAIPPNRVPLNAAALAKLGETPQDEFERTGLWLDDNVPWSAIRRMAARRVIPIQPDLIQTGGCGDGECGLDI